MWVPHTREAGNRPCPFDIYSRKLFNFTTDALDFLAYTVVPHPRATIASISPEGRDTHTAECSSHTGQAAPNVELTILGPSLMSESLGQVRPNLYPLMLHEFSSQVYSSYSIKFPGAQTWSSPRKDPQDLLLARCHLGLSLHCPTPTVLPTPTPGPRASPFLQSLVSFQ